MISNRFARALLLVAALVAVASPAAAQYMYLDANGNGVYDAGDHLAVNGSPTTVDVWVVTDHNRDGSPAECQNDAGASINLISYVINLQAVSGTVSYGGFTNRFGTVPFGELNPGDGIRYKNGSGAIVPANPGTYRLCTLTITGQSGAPGVAIVDEVEGSAGSAINGSPPQTSIGSYSCVGHDFDNTLKLTGPAGGADWTDADGLGQAINEGTPALAPIGNKTVNEGTCLTFTATATAAHGGALVFTLDAGAPSGASITADGQFTWCPTEAQGPGVYPITVRVTEDGAPITTDSETIQVTVNEVNQAPVLDAISNKTIMAGNTLSFTATAADADLPANTLTFSLDPGAPSGATITAGGLFSWPVPVNQVAGATITVRVTDNGTPALSDTKSFFVSVLIHETGPPVVTNPGNKTINEGSCLTFTATATSSGGGTLTFSLGAGAPAGASITPGGVFNFCPTEAQGPGVYTVTINCSDGSLVGSATFSILVLEVNLAPVLNPIGNKTVPLGAPLTFTATATDADIPSNALTFSLDPGAPAGATIGASTGAFSWTPSTGGTFPVTIRVTDNGNLPLSDSETISIFVCLGCASQPVLAPIGNKTINELAPLSFTATATDPDAGQTLTFSLGAGNPAGSAITAGGAFTWIPTEAQGPGTYPITVIVTDDGTPNLADSELIQVQVNEVNLAPVLTDPGNKTVNELALLTFVASATDADLPAQVLTFSLDAGAPVGSTITPGGTFRWTPTESQGPGVYPITIRVSDTGSLPLSDSKTFQVTVNDVNQAPVLASISNKTINQGVLVSFTATATDPDLPVNTLTFSLDPGAPAGATINAASGLFNWTAPFANGTFPITIRVTDNGTPVLSDAKTFTITVTNAQPVAPVLNPIGDKTATEGINLTFTVTGVASQGGQLTFSMTTGNLLGPILNPGNGFFQFLPAESQGGNVYPITICVTEAGTGLSDCETINLTVIENNIPPFINPIGTKYVAPGALVSFTVLGTDADIPFQNLVFSLDPGAPPGASITPGGAFTWTTSAPGSFPITVRLTDDGSPPLSDTETFTVNVTPPLLNPIGDMSVQAGTVAAQTISGTDPDGLPLTFSKASGPFWVTIQTSSPTTGLVTAQPDNSIGVSSNPVVAHATDGTLSDEESFVVFVTSAGCHAPTAKAGGPYSGGTGVPVTFHGDGSSDPDGDPLSYTWFFGDGNSGLGTTVMHAYSVAGTYSVELRVRDTCNLIDSDVTTATISVCLPAYFEGTGNKFATFDLNSGKPTQCVLLEPAAGSFAIEDVDLASIVLRSPNSGSIDEIHAVTTKNALGGDQNRNFVEEITTCFAKEDLRLLFSKVTSTNLVTVTLEGHLTNGAQFCVTQGVTVRAARGGGNLAATISPNPLNPSAVLTFRTEERGPLLVQLFDVRGRLVRTLRQESDAAAGYHDVRIDGTDANGARLSSGVYFVRIRAGADEERKAITILK